jgi:hypothetical protein
MVFKIKKEKLLENACFLLALLPSLLIVTLWHFFNKGLPGDDAAEYWSVTLNIYNHVQEHGFLKFYDVYSIRTWKPLIFPQLASIFLFASHGSTLFMVAATHFVLNFLLCFWLYGLFRIYSTKTYSIISTIFCSTIPGFLTWGFLFYADLPLYVFGVGTVYHLIKSDFFRQKTHSIFFSIVFGLLLCTRPTEAVTVFALPLIIYYLSLSRHHGEKFYKIKPLIIIFVSFAALFATAFFMNYDEFLIKFQSRFFLKRVFEISTAVLFIIFVGITVKSYRKQKDYFLSSISTALLIAISWWLKYVAQLYRWVFGCTFGELAQAAKVTAHQEHLFGSINMYLNGIGYSQIIFPLLLLTLAIIFVLFSKDNQKKLRTTGAKILQEPIFLILLSSFILLTLVISPRIAVFDHRRALLPYMLFSIGILLLISLITQHKKLHYFIFLSAMFLFTSLQTTSILQKIYGQESIEKFYPNNSVASYLLPKTNSLPIPKRESYATSAVQWIYDKLKNDKNCTDKNPCTVFALTNVANYATMYMLNDFVYKNPTIKFKSTYTTSQEKTDEYITGNFKKIGGKFYLALEIDPSIKKYDLTNTFNFLHLNLAVAYINQTIGQYNLLKAKPDNILTMNGKKIILLESKK